MTYRVEISRRASRDFINLYNRIHAEQSVSAAHWFNGLHDSILQLETTPRMGAVTHEYPGLRQLIYGNKPHFYRVIYKVDDGERVVRDMDDGVGCHSLAGRKSDSPPKRVPQVSS